jgi:hypothetical protein
MGKRLVSLLTALALAVSAFASLTVAPAGAVVEDLGNEIYFPFLPNGEEYGNMGPWYSTFTVLNPNNFVITVSVRRADGSSVTTAELQPFASKTWPSSAVFGDGNGGGLVVVGPAQQDIGPNQRQYTVVRGPNNINVDRIPNPCGRGTVPTAVEIRQGDNVFRGTIGGTGLPDYQVIVGPPPNDDLLYIGWTAGGARPAEGTSYTVTVTCPRPITQGTGVGPIAGVAKIVGPVEAPTGRTSGQHEAVSGYTALPRQDVRIPGQHNLVFPIVQTNNGWNSVLHVTNFDSKSNCSVTVTLYQSPSGDTDPSFGNFTRLLNRGQTVHIDLADEGVPAGWVGQAWVSTDCHVAATVDRVKPTQPWGDPVNMALTNQALPTQAGNTAQALPLIFQNYNGWNTGISIANLDPNFVATVTITYYNSAGVAVGTESRAIEQRAMEFVYRPATTDVGIGGFGSALVTSTSPVLVAVDSVKYTGADQDVGQALSYLAQRGVIGAGQLFVPLFQKQGRLSGGNDNSGVALFNAGNFAGTAQLFVFDSSGALVAPTRFSPVLVNVPPKGQFIFYAPDYAEMPGGFQGSIVVFTAAEHLVGVSNNVNYDVTFDGSAAFNMPFSQVAQVQGADDPNNPAGAGNNVVDFTVTGNIGFTTAVAIPTLFRLVEGPGSPEDVSFAVPPADSQVIAATVPAGSATTGAVNGYWRTDVAPPGFDNPVRVEWYYDVNNNGLLDPFDILIDDDVFNVN